MPYLFVASLMLGVVRRHGSACAEARPATLIVFARPFTVNAPRSRNFVAPQIDYGPRARVTKKDHSIALSQSQKRTMSRVASKLRLRFGNLNGMIRLTRCLRHRLSFQRHWIELGNLRSALFPRCVRTGDECSTDFGAVPARLDAEANGLFQLDVARREIGHDDLSAV
jgi:hypothetical protein